MPPRNPPNPRASTGAENATAPRPRAAAAIHNLGASIIVHPSRHADSLSLAVQLTLHPIQIFERMNALSVFDRAFGKIEPGFASE
jgi:hypothetical protein